MHCTHINLLLTSEKYRFLFLKDLKQNTFQLEEEGLKSNVVFAYRNKQFSYIMPLTNQCIILTVLTFNNYLALEKRACCRFVFAKTMLYESLSL